MKDNEDEMNNVIQYLDLIVITINLDMYAPISERHPCQKGVEEINDDLQDYVELINKLQRHTKCSPSYCLRSKQRQQVCRFGYPKERSDHLFVYEDNHGQPELVTSRNDPYLNPHNSKSEPKSAAFTEIFNQILNKSNLDENSLTSIQKLLLNSIAERDISAQETCHLLLGIPLYHSSQQYVLLNLNEEAPRCVRGTGSRENVEDGTTIKEGARTTWSPLRKYWDRDDQFEDFSLYRLYLTHKYTNGSIEELNGDDDIPWSTIYEQHIDTINSDPIDVLGQAFDEEPEISEEESYDEIEEEEEDEEYHYDWMHLAEMGPNVRIQRDTDLGT
ncbi:hypothetical protein RirG_247740 [Rhizophagus irregularis DAOM 197198w]|uniref:Uncharacterized protein n=1 Tax=Rhizophagus irregularis (strain DAOM 197198w) TaxID=1432141 RepID=A0A015K0R8_RHIIW|nr:hypothetical protein RirG_247740 [Rhizophagus irregularis DAOM 197198w]